MAEAVEELRDSLTGDVLVEGDGEYERARLCFSLLIDRRPAAIARCINVEDVAAALAFGQARGPRDRCAGRRPQPRRPLCGRPRPGDRPLAHAARPCRSRKAGCSLPGRRHLAGLRHCDSGPRPGHARRRSRLDRCHGSHPRRSIGHLTAQYGLTCDNLLAAELVTPAGEIVRTSEDENPELLWGLRSGRGNFGVVAQAEFRLHPLERVDGGRLEYEGEGVAQALRLFRDLATDGPRELSIQAQLSTDGSIAPKLLVVPCCTGEEEDPDALRTLRAASGLVNDSVRQGFLEQQRIFDPGYGVDRNYWRGHFVSELSDGLIDDLLRRMTSLGR
jgi:hypothetical protein